MRDNTPSKIYHESEIASLWEILGVVWAGKLRILAGAAVFAVASVIYALSITEQYKATVMLVPTQSSGGGLSAALGRLGGLASLAGVNVGSGGGVRETKVAQEIMMSRSFIEDFIAKNDLAVELAAVKGWDKEKDSLIINDEIYDIESRKWLQEYGKPSSWGLYKTFYSMIDMSETKSGLTSLSITHFSPHVSKRLLDLYVAAINDHMRERQVAKAKINISYLEAQIDKTSVIAIQGAIYSIVEDQLKSMMLAETSKNYIFNPVGPIMAPEKKISPNRTLIVISWTALGVLMLTLLLLFRNYYKKGWF